ncbi:hypothetical protein [Kosakonia sp. R1.Fl]|uniref:hypothetical protein n=1 Tax=Kosakonia sp. R1.Fl TaxID=2928706 RepID=UPI00201E5B18|nr:hypothetical protein [Kosakonia sp. R1.Fl]
MIPDYLKFIRVQDKKILPFLFIVVFIMIGFYWKNNGFEFNKSDVYYLSGIVGILLFSSIYELKAFWAYKCVTKAIDFSFFSGKKLGRMETSYSHPFVASILFAVVVGVIIQGFFFLHLPMYILISLLAILPIFMYIVFRILRNSYIKQVATAAADKVKYKHLYRYVFSSLSLGIILNLLTVSPLKRETDFSFLAGVFSARVVVAMFILCCIVLMMNLLFTRLSKRYIFLGRLFLKEIDFYFSVSLPWPAFYDIPFLVRIILLLIIEFVWIILVSMMLAWSGWQLWFEIYFLVCFLPCIGFNYLHIYALWHRDFLMACDMYFRWGTIEKQTHLW